MTAEAAAAAGYRQMRLGGRCADGAERDSGTLIHTVPPRSAKALCGASYGRRSAGWFLQEAGDSGRPCPRCAVRLGKAVA